MATRTRRMEARVDPETDERISKAAALNHESVSAFIVRASRAEADRVLARADVTVMSAEQFDLMVESLDHADEAPRLAEVAARPRRFSRG